MGPVMARPLSVHEQDTRFRRSTLETATNYVIDLVEAPGSAHREDFDVAGIVWALHDLTDDWAFHAIDRRALWAIIAAHMR